MEITRGSGVDHIFETLGGSNYHRSVEAAAMGARITMIGFLESTDVPAAFGHLERGAFGKVVSINA